MSLPHLEFRERNRVILDALSLLWIVLATLIFLYTSTFIDEDPIIAEKGLVGFSLLIAGLFMTYMTVGVKWDLEITRREWNEIAHMIGVSLVAIMLLNVMTLRYFSLNVSGVNRSLFNVLIGVSEEALFRGFLLMWIYSMTGNALVSVFASSIIFTTYHGAVYGLNQPALLIVFGAGLTLGAVFLYTKRLSVTMTGHGIINLLAMVAGG